MMAASDLADAYSLAGRSWSTGPSRIYDVLAREQIAAAGIGLGGARVLDLGAGTGAASRAAVDAGATSVVALDVAAGMLAVDPTGRPPAVVGDALALPFPSASFDAVIAAFSLNHVDDPAAALREAARITSDGGWVLASSYADDDSHPVKQVVEAVLHEWGWRPADWERWMRAGAFVELATPARAVAAGRHAGLADVAVDARRVEFPWLDARQLVQWRLGMASAASFLAGLDDSAREQIEDAATRRLVGSAVPTTRLVRSVLYLRGRVNRARARPRR